MAQKARRRHYNQVWWRNKKLKSFLIEKKVPARLRDNLPVLAYKNEVYVVASVDISEKVKIDENTKSAYAIEYVVE